MLLSSVKRCQKRSRHLTRDLIARTRHLFAKIRHVLDQPKHQHQQKQNQKRLQRIAPAHQPRQIKQLKILSSSWSMDRGRWVDRLIKSEKIQYIGDILYRIQTIFFLLRLILSRPSLLLEPTTHSDHPLQPNNATGCCPLSLKKTCRE